MEQYTDQGKVETRSGILFVSLVCIFVLMPALSSCWRKDNVDNHLFVLEYQVDGGEKQVYEVKEKDITFLGPVKWDIDDFWILSEKDSLACHGMNIFHHTTIMQYEVVSDTSFFYEGETYYMSSDSIVLFWPSSVLLPGLNGRDYEYDVVRDKSWVRFHLVESGPIWYSIDFKYVTLHYPKWPDTSHKDTVVIQGVLDLYYGIQNHGLKTALIKQQ
jgi:hypothetical protein